MSISKRVGSGATFQLAARLCSAMVSFVVTAVVLARVLEPEEYGRFNFWLTVFLLALTLVDFGVNRAAIRMISAREAERGATIAAARWVKIFVSVIAFLAMLSVAFVSEEGLKRVTLLALACAHVLSHGLGAGSIAFEVDVEFKTPALSVVLGAAFFLLAGLALAASGVEQAEPFLIAYGAGLALQNGTLWLRARRVQPIAARPDPELVRRVVREALPLGLSAIAIAIYYYADTLMLRPLRGEVEVAEYSVAYRLMSFALMVPVLGSQVVFPVFTRCAATSSELLGKAVRRATFYLGFVGCAGTCVFLAFAEPLLGLVYGQEYTVAAPTLRCLGVALVIVYLTYPHTTALIACGRAATFTRITAASAGLNVGLNLLAIPRFGPLGAAATTLVTELFVCVAGVVSLWRAQRVHGASRALLGCGIALCLGLLLANRVTDAWGWVAGVGAVLVVFAVAAIPLRVLPFDLGVKDAEFER